MALTDLLWACPRCGERDAWVGSGRGARCGGCGTRFVPGRGGLVVAQRGGEREEAPAAEWVDRLGEPALPEGEDDPEAAGAARVRVALRRAQSFEPVHWKRRYLGRFERYGAPVRGMLTLTREALWFLPENGERQRWALDEVEAVQASSSSLQFRTRRGPVVSVHFLEGSCRYWEQLVTAALRALYRRLGRGEIAEFQPRITTGNGPAGGAA